jgi:hypothetical protein
VPNIAQKNQTCKTTDYKVAGSMVIWSSKCVGMNNSTEGSGEIVYNNKDFEGSMHMTRVSRDPKIPPVSMSYTLNGNFDGACEQ